MRKLINYTHLATKIRAMLGNMLTEEDFDSMAHMNSVQDIAGYLKNHTYYKPHFEALDANEIHRGELEVILYRAMITDALKIAKHLKGWEKSFYRYVYRKQEVEDLKKMLRALQIGKSLKAINRQTLFISRYSKIDFNVSLEATNARELVDTLKNSKYYTLLKPLLKEDDTIDLFSAEMSLDMYYYGRLYHQIRKHMRGEDKTVMLRDYGLDVDFRNMLWIYRSKKYYKMSKERIFTYLIPGGYKLNKEELVNLVEAVDGDAVMARLKKGPYGSIIDFDSGHWGNGFYSYASFIYRSNIRLKSTTIAPMVDYIFLKEIEIVNLTTIIEGVRYRIAPDEVEKFVSKQH